MRNDIQIPCPECGHEFKPVDQTWRVCLVCGRIFDRETTDGEWREHKSNECLDSLGTSVLAYNEADAKEKQARWIERRRGVDDE